MSMSGTSPRPARLCVYCGSNAGAAPAFRDAAQALGEAMARRGITLVYGGGQVGLMGVVADAALAAGGEVIYAGKPYRPIYEQALAIAAKARGRPFEQSRVLAIGDSVRTDLKGAAAFGIDCLFVVAGIHAEELGGHDAPDTQALDGMFAAAGVYPNAAMRRLVW